MPHTLLPELAQDYTRLREYFQALDTDGIAIAYSGGVDSTLLLKVACEASSRPVLAVILETELHPHSEIETAVAMAKKLKAECTVIHVDEFQDPQILQIRSTAATFASICSSPSCSSWRMPTDVWQSVTAR